MLCELSWDNLLVSELHQTEYKYKNNGGYNTKHNSFKMAASRLVIEGECIRNDT